MGCTSSRTQPQERKTGNTCPKVPSIFLKVSEIRASKSDGAKKSGMERDWARQRGERDRQG